MPVCKTVAINFALTVALLLLTALSACDSRQPRQITLSGKLTYPDDTPIPHQATARISIVEHGADGGEKRIVAERSLHHIGAQPIEFKIRLARSLIDPGGHYGLRAKIVAEDGQVRLKTPASVRIRLRDRSRPLSIRLVANTSRRANLSFQKYRCDDGFHLAAVMQADRAIVRLGNNRRLDLDQVASRNPRRFRDEHDNQLRVVGDKIALRIDGDKHGDCAIVASKKADAGGAVKSKDRS